MLAAILPSLIRDVAASRVVHPHPRDAVRGIPPGTRRAQVGLSMVELLVAMAVGLFLVGGIVQLFVSSKASYRLGEAESRVQENGRFAIQLLAADWRGARAVGCPVDAAGGSLTVVACSLLNPADGPAGCSGPPAIGADRPLGYAASQKGTADWLAGLPGNQSTGAQAEVASQWLRGDVLVSWGTVGEGVYARVSSGSGGTDLTRPIELVSPLRDLVGGRLALITDCQATDLFTITNPGQCQGLNLAPPSALRHDERYDPEDCTETGSSGEKDESGGQVNSAPALAHAYNRKGSEGSPGPLLRARVFPFEYSVSYICCVDSRNGSIEEDGAVGNCATDPSRYRPALCRWTTSAGAQQYVSDVADLRVIYDGYSDPAGGTRFLDVTGDEDVPDAVWVSAQGYWDRVDSARIRILATAAEEVRTAARAPNPDAAATTDLGAGLPADRRVYQTFDVTAAIRSNAPWYLLP